MSHRTFSTKSYREQHRRRFPIPSSFSFNDHLTIVHQDVYPIKLRRRRRKQNPISFYDNDESAEREIILSKWTIVRQRLPDILAMSSTYRPTTMRAQLVLLVALMHKRSKIDSNGFARSNSFSSTNSTIARLIPANVLIDNGGRTRSICLKRIPPEQVIYIDVDGLSYSIPTQQFLLAISRHQSDDVGLIKYCPPAISEMLVDLSATKIIDDREQYRRALFKKRFGQLMFLIIFVLLMIMIVVLTVSLTRTVFKFDSLNSTWPYQPQTTSDIHVQPVPVGHREEN